MLTLTQFLLVMTLAPLIAGLLLVIGGKFIPRGVGLGLGILAVVVAFVAALFVAGNVLPEGPQLVPLVHLGNGAITQRLDGFSAYLLIGITAWIAPVLLWVTMPRLTGDAVPLYTLRPMGLALVALSLTMGAVLDDNIWLSVLCWAGTGFVAWLIARPEPFHLPQESQEWLDLLLMTLGPILFGLTMLFPITSGHSQSFLDLAGRHFINFGAGILIILSLAFAAGIYPFTLWVRRVTQGIMTEAIATLLLLVTPVAVVMLGRLIALVVTSDGSWPTIQVGPATVPLSALLMLLGIITPVVCGFVLLFEQDLPIVTALLGALPLSWSFVAIGANDGHALIGVMFLLLAYVVGVGTSLAVWSSLEWSDREVIGQRLHGIARSLPFHFAALVLAGLTLVGVPLLGGFAGMAIIDQSIIGLGGAATLGGALIWVGNTLALLGFLRFLVIALSNAPTDATAYPANAPVRREGVALVVPVALLLLIGIAPELLLLAKGADFGPAHVAANALLGTGTSVPDVSSSALGFAVNTTLWLPGLFWILAIVIAGVTALAAGLIGITPLTSPVFAGGEPLLSDATTKIDSWNDLALIPRSPFVLPGPATWREDIGDPEEWAQPETTVLQEEEIDDDDLSAEDLDDEEVIAEEDEATDDEVVLPADDEVLNEDEADAASADEVIIIDSAAPSVAEPSVASPPIEDTEVEDDVDAALADEEMTDTDEAPPAPTVNAKPTPTVAQNKQIPGYRKGGKGGKRGRR